VATTETEVVVARLWEQLLGLRPDENSDFFADGGHSLLAARFMAKLSKLLDTELDVAIVFGAPRFGDLCEVVTGPPPTDRVPVESGAHGHDRATAHRLPMLPGQKSVVRKRIAAERDGRAPSAFTLPTLEVTLAPSVTLSDAERALRAVIARQPSLRTVLDADLTVEIHPADQIHVDIEQVTAGSLQEASTLGQALSRRPFTLDEVPRLRAVIVAAAEHRYLMLCLDHLIADQYAARIVVDELLEELRRPGVPRQRDLANSRTAALGRVAADLTTLMEGPRLAESMRYWSSATGGHIVPRTALVDLPQFEPSNTVDAVTSEVSLTPKAWPRVAQCAQQNATTPFAVLMASVWHYAQQRGAREYLVTPVANRRTADASDLAAFLSHVVVRVPPALRSSPAELVTYAGGLLRESAAHEWVAHATLVEALAPGLYGRIRPYPWVVLDLDQDPWPEGIRELLEPAWNNTVIRLQFSVAEPVLSLRCTAGSDVLSTTDAEDLVLGVAASLGQLLDSLSSE